MDKYTHTIRAACGIWLLISKEEAEAAEIETFVESKFGGSLPAFVAAFTKHQDLSDSDLDEVQKMIDRIRKGGGSQ